MKISTKTGNKLQREGKTDEAIAQYRQLIESTPNFYCSYYNLGDLLVQTNHLTEAIAQYQNALEITPNSAFTHYRLGEAHLEQDSLKEAISSFQNAIKIKPNFHKFHNGLGQVLARQGQWDNAASCFERAIALKSNSCWAYYNLGEVLSKQKKWEKAIIQYEEAIRLNPYFSRTHLNLGEAWIQAGELDATISKYRRAIELDPNILWHYMKVGEALTALGKEEEAIATYRKAIQLNPHSVWSHYKLWSVIDRYHQHLENFFEYKPLGYPNFPKANCALKNRQEWADALEQMKSLGLPRHEDAPKNWDTLAALDCIFKKFEKKAKILDAGAELYSAFLPCLYLYGYKNLIGINLTIEKPIRYGSIRYEYGDITKTEFDDNTFDAIACLSVIEHGVDLDAYLQEMSRILKPGGVLITSTDYYAEQIDTQNKTAYGVPIHVFNQNEIQQVYKRARELELEPTTDLDLSCEEKAITWQRFSLDYTFLIFILQKSKSSLGNYEKIKNSGSALRVDLGCGTNKPEGYIGVDQFPGEAVDIVADLNQKFPFPDHSVDEIRAYDFIEHLPKQIHTMNEIWRIGKPNATVDIFVPSTDGRGAFQDPTYVSFWNVHSFFYYCVDYPHYLELCHRYGFNGVFKVNQLENIQGNRGVIHVKANLTVIKDGLYALGHEINFAVDGNADSYLISGWSRPEKWGCWTLGLRAELKLELTEEPTDDLILRIKGKPYVPEGKTEVRLGVELGTKSVGEVLLPADKVTTTEFKLPHSIISGTKILELSLYTPDHRQPKPDDTDKREHAFSIYSIFVNG